MNTLTKKVVSLTMALMFVFTCILATAADIQAAGTSKSLSVKGPTTTLLQLNTEESMKVKVTVKIVSVGKGAQSVTIGDVLKISGKNLKKGYKKSFTISNDYGTEKVLTIDGSIKIKLTATPKGDGDITLFELNEDAG